MTDPSAEEIVTRLRQSLQTILGWAELSRRPIAARPSTLPSCAHLVAFSASCSDKESSLFFSNFGKQVHDVGETQLCD